MSNETIAKNATQTSAKFYKPKVLSSVTWHGDRIVSVDLDEKRVMGVWLE